LNFTVVLRSGSPKEKLPDELKKHLDFELVDTKGMTPDDLRQIPYTKVEVASKTGKGVRYNSSIKSNRVSTLRQEKSQ